MTPTSNYFSVTTKVESSKTYKIDWENGRIMSLGTANGVEAAHQAIRKNIETVRYAYPIYDGVYGANPEPYLGKDFDYVGMEIERNTREALLADSRNLDIQDFVCTQDGSDFGSVSYTVATIYGDVRVKEVI